MAGAFAPPPPAAAKEANTEAYAHFVENGYVAAARDPRSTFSASVDTAAYSLIRAKINGGELPPKDAVRTEELVNYFRYDYSAPDDRAVPFSVTTDVARTPWNPNTRLLRIGLRGYDLPRAERPPANLVFLIDVSGSMSSPDKLGLAKQALSILTRGLKEQDTVSLVTYAGSTRVVLEPTHDQKKILAALEKLESAGSTGMASGIDLAYKQAMKGVKPGHISRVIVLSDGDANVGPHTHDEIQPLTPGQVYELDVEVWPTSIVVPAGYRLGLTVRGRDYEYPGGPSAGLGTLGAVFTGVGPFQHNDAHDRPPEVFGQTVTLHSGPARPAHVLLPVIPAQR